MRRTDRHAPPGSPGRAGGRTLWTATAIPVVVVLSGCGGDEASPVTSSGEAVTTPRPAPTFTDPMALADALGCADSFVDEMPGGREGINHAECEVDGQPVEIYVVEDDVALEHWATDVSGFASVDDLAASERFAVRGLWALGSDAVPDVEQLADAVASESAG